MGATVRFGVTSMLVKDIRKKERFAFLESFVTLEVSDMFFEELRNYHDPGSAMVVYRGGINKLHPYTPEDEEIYNELWDKALPITYKNWDLLQNIDLFVPAYTATEPQIAFIPELRRNITISSLEHGLALMEENTNTADHDETAFRDIMIYFFGLAQQYKFIVAIYCR